MYKYTLSCNLCTLATVQLKHNVALARIIASSRRMHSTHFLVDTFKRGMARSNKAHFLKMCTRDVCYYNMQYV